MVLYSYTYIMISAIILADHREDTGANPYLGQMISINNRSCDKMSAKSGGGEIVSQIVNNATIGDYTIMLPSKNDPSKNIIAAVFERKTWKDLAASLKDQRAVTQHKNMIELRESNGCLLYYIMEGGLTYQDTTKIARIPFKNLHAKMRSMSLKGVHSFQTKDQQDTARLLVNLARDLSRLYHTNYITFNKQELSIIQGGSETEETPEQELNKNIRISLEKYKASLPLESANDNAIIQTLENLVDMTSTSESVAVRSIDDIKDIPLIDVPSILTTRPIRRNDDIIMNMWCALPGVSSKSAPVLMKNLNLKEVLTVSENDVANTTDKITHFSYISGNKFGRQRAEKIMQIGYHGDNERQLQVKKDLSSRVLSQVPGITIDVANLILDKFDLAQILSGEHQEEISNIKRNNRRIGKKITNRILSIFVSTPEQPPS